MMCASFIVMQHTPFSNSSSYNKIRPRIKPYLYKFIKKGIPKNAFSFMKFVRPEFVDVPNVGNHPIAFLIIVNAYVQFQMPISRLHKDQ